MNFIVLLPSPCAYFVNDLIRLVCDEDRVAWVVLSHIVECIFQSHTVHEVIVYVIEWVTFICHKLAKCCI